MCSEELSMFQTKIDSHPTRPFLRGMWLSFVLLAAVSMYAQDGAADSAMATIRPEAIRADMRFLADDLLEGRGTATRGFDIAAQFMATQFEGIGLQPAGHNGTYFQNVPLRLLKPDPAKSALVITHRGKEETLTFGKDYLSGVDPVRADRSTEAPVVFVGYGVTALEQGYDDYKGVDAKGKIVALIFGAPDFPSSIRAYYTSPAVKTRTAVAHGAAGVIVLNDPNFEQMYPFSKRVRDLIVPEFRWLDKQGLPNPYFPGLKGVAFLSMDATRHLFDGSSHTAEEVFAAAKAGKLAPFALPITAKIHNVTQSQDTHSSNVVARLEGSDRALNEALVYSAHLDHLGVGEPVEGDNIYNGALDNASGSATILEVARALSRMERKPRRSILFVAFTGEEAGLIGSDYFCHNPTIAKGAIVADLNIDQVPMFWPVQDIVAFGAEHSSLDAVIRKAAEHMHLAVTPDPMPEEVVFIRSDQYSFVQQGIPSVMPSPGIKSSDPTIKPMDIFMNWLATRQHQPNDDMQQPGLDFEAAATFARYVFFCGYMIADDSQKPTWNKGDFFAEHFKRSAE
jgi:Zn-dependent M28 family amino/carboxypeptidase